MKKRAVIRAYVYSRLLSVMIKKKHVGMKATQLIALFLFANNVFGQSASDTLSQLANQNQYTFTYDESFQGQGWDMIIDLAKKHKYFLIGEDHGFSEIPTFTLELNKVIEYDLFVTEIDSITAAISDKLVKSKEGNIQTFHEQNPSALSFFSAKEEFDLLTALVKSGSDVWGLDQVSLFSTGIVFRQLRDVSKSEEAKERTEKLANLSDSLFIEASESGNYDILFIFSSKQKVFDDLEEILKNEGSKANSIFNNLRLSWEIYNGINNANHFTRIGEMKRQLLNYYMQQIQNRNQYEKILYKFGAYHLAKGQSPLGGFDVGNFVVNLAHAEASSSYHLMIVGKRGEVNTFLPTNGMTREAFTIENENSPLNPLMPFAELVDQDKWSFFDLKPIRNKLKKGELKTEDPFLQAVIYGYDGLVIIPEVTPSTIIKN